MQRSFSEPIAPAPTDAPALKSVLDHMRTKGCLQKFMKLVVRDSVLWLLLDIDQCSIVGGDTNDILRVVLAKYADASKETLEELALKFVNKWMVQAVKAILARHPNTHVMFYTNKHAILRYMHYYCGVELPYICDGTILFDWGSVEQGHKYISAQYPSDTPLLVNELDRLGLVTWAGAAALGLDYLPAVIVTEVSKDVEKIATALGVDKDRVFLFDDRAEEHIAAVGSQYAREHVIPVQPFDFTTICEEQARELLAVLNEHFPAKGIKKEHPKLFRQIVHDPSWPLENHSLNEEEEWVVRYPGGQTMEPWTIDRILKAAKTEAVKDGALSKKRGTDAGGIFC